MLSDQEKASIREALGRLEEQLPNFRRRAPQLQMMAAVAGALGACHDVDAARRRADNIAVVEAGTGTGKTLGYLVPALVLARSRGKHLVVSSSTIALQEQLCNKDVPALQDALPWPFTFAIAKGRGRYVCLAKLQQKMQEEAQGSIDIGAASGGTTANREKSVPIYSQLAERFDRSAWSGDRDELSMPLREEQWQALVTDRQGCAGSRCPHFANCPFYAARQRVKEADLIIANHDLVLSALDMPTTTVLPDPAESFFVFDEAHRLPDKVLEHFAARHALLGAASWTEDIPTIIRDAVLALHLDRTLYRQGTELSGRLAAGVRALHQRIDGLQAFEERRVRRFKHGKIPAWLHDSGAAILDVAEALRQCMSTLRAAMLEKAGMEAHLVQRLLSNAGFFIGKLDRLVDTWTLMLEGEEDAGVPTARWIEAIEGASGRDYLICASPIGAGERLHHLLWKRASAVVLTSATLTACEDFAPFLRQIGLGGREDVRLLTVESPFDYSRQAKLSLPAMRHAPDDIEAHTREVVDRLPALIQSAGTLVLFASRRQMLAVHERLSGVLKACVLMQGALSKREMLDRHRAAIDAGQQSILFGLASFAEGVDLPGEYCTHVVIAKLPFSVPDHPLEEARREWVESLGKSAFVEISLPEVGIRLAQGVGRLLRTDADHGTVTILDRRLVTKSWGRRLLQGLPPFKVEIGMRAAPPHPLKDECRQAS